MIWVDEFIHASVQYKFFDSILELIQLYILLNILFFKLFNVSCHWPNDLLISQVSIEQVLYLVNQHFLSTIWQLLTIDQAKDVWKLNLWENALHYLKPVLDPPGVSNRETLSLVLVEDHVVNGVAVKLGDSRGSTCFWSLTPISEWIIHIIMIGHPLLTYHRRCKIFINFFLSIIAWISLTRATFKIIILVIMDFLTWLFIIITPLS